MLPGPLYDSKASSDKLQTLIRTLLTSGYLIPEVKRETPSSTIIVARKRDLLGSPACSVILLTDTVVPSLINTLKKTAKWKIGEAILVTDKPQTSSPDAEIRIFSLPELYQLLGGRVRTDRLFRSDLPEVMDTLGHNQLPAGFVGTSDDLLEDYVRDSLQFLLECPVHRYGQERRFESLPDGLAVGKPGLNIYFDAKAYSEGFHPSADDIKRFAGYVIDFNERFDWLLGPIHSFLVVSGEFPKARDSLEAKSNELYSLAKTKLTFLTARNLAKVVEVLKKGSQFRAAIRWSKVFSELEIEPKIVEDELKRVKQGGLIPV